MHIVYFVNGKNACSYFRCILPEAKMRQWSGEDHSGIVLEFNHDERAPGLLQRLSHEDREKIRLVVDWADIIIITRVFDWRQIIKIAQDTDTPVIYETDDYPIPDKKHFLRSVATKKKFRQNMYYALKKADGMICSTTQLKETFQKKIAPIEVVPNMLDYNQSQWQKRKKYHWRKTIIGYIGSPTHYYDLQLTQSAILQLMEEYFQVHLWYGAIPEKIRDVQMKNGVTIKTITRKDKKNALALKYKALFDQYPKRVKCLSYKPIEEYGKTYTHFDIGIAPLESNFFNMHKSNLKLLEYAAYDIPVVASDIQPFRETIRHGETGFLARDTEDWHQYLKRLIEDKDLRQTMGKRFGEEIREEYDINEHWDRHIQAIQKIVG